MPAFLRYYNGVSSKHSDDVLKVEDDVPIDIDALGDLDEDRLLRKIDLRMLPPITIIYVLAFLDRLAADSIPLGCHSGLTPSQSEYRECVTVQAP